MTCQFPMGHSQNSNVCSRPYKFPSSTSHFSNSQIPPDFKSNPRNPTQLRIHKSLQIPIRSARLMVSNCSNPPGSFYQNPTGMALSDLSQFSGGVGVAAGVAVSVDMLGEDEPDKKIRKPYTTTKSRQSWTDPEHDKFLEALQLFDRDWKKIEAFIGSKTVIQIRSHAQKYFLKVQKSGGNEHLPPPRPKRKAAHPYPHKASKNAPPNAQMTEPLQSSMSGSLPKPGYVFNHDMSSLPGDLTSNAAAASSWTGNSAQIPNTSQGHLNSTAEATALNSSSSAESTPRVQSTHRMPVPVNKSQAIRVLPDFAQVYGFIGSVFDPNVTGHLQHLKQMDPIDVETVLLLMRNLSVNLTSPDFEDHRKILSSHEFDSKDPSYDAVGI